MSVYLKNDYYYSNPRKQFLSKIGELSIQNHNRKDIDNNQKNINIIKSGFFRDDHNSIDAISCNPKTSVFSNPKKDIFNSLKEYDSSNNSNISYKDKNNNKYTSDSINNDYINNNYEIQISKSNNNKLSNSLIYGSDPIYNKLYESKRQYNNNSTNDYNNGLLNSIITSKIGLNNLGNTCYMNTSLQCLIHSEDFIERLLSNTSYLRSNAIITQKFINLCKEMGSATKSISPYEFKNNFGSKHRIFSGYGQNDTQEFCRVLLEDMNKELNCVHRKQPYIEFKTKGKSKIQCDIEFDELFRKRESSIVMDSFYGQIINIFTCQCNYKDYSFQKVLDLPLLLNNKYSNYSNPSLNELLDEYFSIEEIEFEVKCENCKKRRTHTKETKITHPPNILILSLQRFNEKSKRKNTCSVYFSEELNLKKYIDKECYEENKYEYRLYAIGNHSGNIDFGHYYSYIKINDKTWYEFNDSTVSKIGRININSPYAYTFFYKKVI